MLIKLSYKMRFNFLKNKPIIIFKPQDLDHFPHLNIYYLHLRLFTAKKHFVVAVDFEFVVGLLPQKCHLLVHA